MEAQQLMTAVVAAFALGAVLAWGGARWWFGHQLRGAAAHQERTEQGRQLAALQAAQARRQVDQLQQELADLRLAAKRRPGQGEAPPVRPVFTPIFDDADQPDVAPDGFAQTQIMPRQR